MKLTELRGKENLPIKLEEKDRWPSTAGAELHGFNQAVDRYNQLEIDGDVEAVAEYLYERSVGASRLIRSDIPLWQDLINTQYNVRLFFLSNAKDIASNLSKFLVIKKGG